LNGHDEGHAIRKVTFRTCLSNGQPVKKEDVEVNKYVYDLRFED